MPIAHVVARNNIGQGLKIDAGKLTANVDGKSVVINQDGKLTVPAYCYGFNRAGRVYCYADDRWISQIDDNYGSQYVNYEESGGTGDSPLIEWENRGDFIRAGTMIHDLTVRGRFNNGGDFNDFIIEAYLVVPNDPSRLQGVGINDDSHFSAIQLFRYSWYNGLNGSNPLGVAEGSMGDKLYQRKIPVNFLVADDAELRLFYKPVSKSPRPSASTRLFIHTTSWLLSQQII